MVRFNKLKNFSLTNYSTQIH